MEVSATAARAASETAEIEETTSVDQPSSPDAPPVVTVRPKRRPAPDRRKRRIPRYNVILWDSDDHSYEYVERMLRELFGHTPQECRRMAETVDSEGQCVVLTTTKEHAELKRDQIHSYGRDEHMDSSKGSMWSTIEPVE
jgi:ATP-dependent Clp protease adaptor protein ClpS